jgi:hypothetical protein
MDRPVSVFARGGSYSVCSSVAVIAHNVSREQALLAIGDHVPGATVQEINQWLNQPSDAAEFRATWASAVSGTLQFLEGQIAVLPSTEVTDKLADQLATVGDSVAKLKRENYRSEICRQILDLETEAESRIQTIIAEDGWTDKRARDLIYGRIGFGAAIAEWKQKLEKCNA